MFTNFVHSYTGQPRHAESSDARLHIRRQDPEQQGRKGKKGDEEEELFDDQDRASVSTEDLQAFLENFLKSLQDDAQKEQKGENVDVLPENTAPKPAMSMQAAHAHNAYAAASRAHTHSHDHSNDLSGVDAQQAANSLGLSGAEVRTIHALIDDLKDLRERGYDSLLIERSETFLQSLVHAVEKVKNA